MPKFFRQWFASGEPWIWMNAAAVGISITAVLGILGLIAFKGFAHFWPAEIHHIQYLDSQGEAQEVYAEQVQAERIPVQQYLPSSTLKSSSKLTKINDV